MDCGSLKTGHEVHHRSKEMKDQVMKFVSNEDGLTTVEYAIAGGLVGAAVIAAFLALGGQVGRIITDIWNALTAVVIA
jgi:pilus assembly protein Flp/PilA